MLRPILGFIGTVLWEIIARNINWSCQCCMTKTNILSFITSPHIIYFITERHYLTTSIVYNVYNNYLSNTHLPYSPFSLSLPAVVPLSPAICHHSSLHLTIPEPARERHHIPDALQARQEQEQPLQAEAEAGRGRTAVAP